MQSPEEKMDKNQTAWSAAEDMHITRRILCIRDVTVPYGQKLNCGISR